MSCGITSTAQSNKDTFASCCRLLDFDHLQLGGGRHNKHETPANKMQEYQIEAIWLWIYSGIVLLGTTTHFSVTGGYSPDTTSERTIDGLMGNSDAKGRGWPTDVLETGVLRLALPIVDRRGGLAPL